MRGVVRAWIGEHLDGKGSLRRRADSAVPPTSARSATPPTPALSLLVVASRDPRRSTSCTPWLLLRRNGTRSSADEVAPLLGPTARAGEGARTSPLRHQIPCRKRPAAVGPQQPNASRRSNLAARESRVVSARRGRAGDGRSRRLASLGVTAKIDRAECQPDAGTYPRDLRAAPGQ